MADVVIVFVLLAVLGGAAAYVIRAKRRGQKCIGCPYGAQCARQHGGAPCSCSDRSE